MRSTFLEGVKRVHLVGIGGVGMSGIAHLLLKLGYSVSGSDTIQTEVTRRLAESGAKIYKGHREKNPGSVDLIIFSSAIPLGNPELQFAMRRNIPCFPRSWFLAEMMNEKAGIAITGTHGKTTTTSMVALILKKAGLDPTVLIGGNLDDIRGSAWLGKGEYIVAEADESDGSFMSLSPQFAVVTNIEDDHLDYYGNIDSLIDAFMRFSDSVSCNGGTVFFSDHRNNLRLLRKQKRPLRRVSLYGFGEDCTVRGVDVKEEFGKTSFSILCEGKRLGKVELYLPGTYNIYNGLAATAVARAIGVEFDVVRDALSSYQGTKRRFEIRGEADSVLVVEDYAHHPTEIKLALKAATKSKRRVVAVFQPHRHTRTARLWKSLGRSFRDAEVLIVTDIYGAGEQPIRDVTSKQIVQTAKEHGHRCACYIPDMWDVVGHIEKIIRRGDILLILGAGNISQLAQPILEALKSGTW